MTKSNPYYRPCFGSKLKLCLREISTVAWLSPLQQSKRLWSFLWTQQVVFASLHVGKHSILENHKMSEISNKQIGCNGYVYCCFPGFNCVFNHCENCKDYTWAADFWVGYQDAYQQLSLSRVILWTRIGAVICLHANIVSQCVGAALYQVVCMFSHLLECETGQWSLCLSFLIWKV